MSEKYKITCKICGKEFEASYKRTKLCSAECKKENKKLYARNQAIERKEKNRELMGTKFCVVCGKEFSARNWNQKTCSRKCFKEHARKTDAINKKKKKEEVVKVKNERSRKQIASVQDNQKAQEAGMSYGKYALIPYLAKQSKEMAKRRRELDAEWERKRKNGNQ